MRYVGVLYYQHEREADFSCVEEGASQIEAASTILCLPSADALFECL